MRTIMLLLFSGWLLSAFLPSAQLVVTGYVTDGQAPLAGVTVKVKGKSTGTTTDQNGYFSISVPNENAILEFLYVGYETMEVKVGSKNNLSISLKPREQKLDEVVVTGYAPMRKKELTGSVSSIRIRGANGYASPGQGGYVIVREHDREGYDRIDENGFKSVGQDPLSTFSIDVDAASYSNVRRFINQGMLPPAGAVRVEEMINYFQYGYAQPKNNDPFAIYTELADCPWAPQHKLLLVGLQGKQIPNENLPASNITFLVDVSGSMASEDKLPLVKSALKLLADQIREQDKVSIVVYAGAAGLALAPTSDKVKIKQALDQLEAGGSTAGGAGIQLAYKTAKDNFIRGGNNRVVLCTDGDFNVGQSSDDELIRMIEEQRKSGVFLTVLGFGTGNYQDAKMQKLADKGNGNHAYIDQMNEAKKVFVREFGGTMFTIAKDVKFQLEFNPAQVQGYRLIGYENRLLNKEDFNDDKKDAGEMGSNHTVTALYEIIPAGVETDLLGTVDPLKYSQDKGTKNKYGQELLTIKVRYKKPDEDVSRLLSQPVKNESVSYKRASGQLKMAAAVASFGMILSESKYKGESDFILVRSLATAAVGDDPGGYRREFIELCDKAGKLYQAKK